MKEISVSRLAAISGLTVRALRYYDKIGLLKPGRQADNNYRFYSEADCLKLQQIMLYRELEIPLETIKALMECDDHENLSALKQHHFEMLKRQRRTEIILQTVSDTIQKLERKTTIMDYTDLFIGFSKEEAENMTAEAKERWGEHVVSESHEKLMKHSAKDWEGLVSEGEMITRELAKRRHLPADESSVQEWTAKHFRHIGKHFDVTKEIYANMGKMYAEDERFRAYYERFGSGLANFMNEAISIYSKH